VHQLLQIDNSQTKFVTMLPPSSILPRFPTTIKVNRLRGTMMWDTTRGLGGRRLVLLIGLVLALGGCAQLTSQQSPAQSAPVSQQQTASIKLPPF
jgi:hypothetical protein